MSSRNIAIIVGILVVLAVGAWALGWFATDTAMDQPPAAPATTQTPAPATDPAPAAGPDTGAAPPADTGATDPALPEATDDTTTAPAQQ